MKENQLEESLRVRKYEVLKDFDEPYAVAGILKKLFDKL